MGKIWVILVQNRNSKIELNKNPGLKIQYLSKKFIGWDISWGKVNKSKDGLLRLHLNKKLLHGEENNQLN